MRDDEVERMAQVEQQLWWYRCLHKKVRQTLSHVPRDAAILDVGCGTGGVLQTLRNAGFRNLVGCDLSPVSVKKSGDLGFKVIQCNAREVKKYFSPSSLDALISLDVLCYFTAPVALEVLESLLSCVKPGGSVVLNLPARKLFRGSHDKAVGIVSRTEPKPFLAALSRMPVKEIRHHSWPTLLSPLIAATRFASRWKSETTTSDVGLPPRMINELFYTITAYEGTWSSFGSSVFVSCLRV